MSGGTPPSGTRRTVIAGVAATLGTGTVAAARRTTDSVDVDADNLVAGNRRFTVTVDGVHGEEIEEMTVTVGGVSFAAVEVLAGDPAVLAVDASNLVESGSVRDRDAVEVAVWVATGDGEFAGTDESQVIVE